MKNNLIKWLICILATLITLLVSYAVGKHFLFTGFIFSWILNFWLMTWYTILVSQINPKLDSTYFDVKPFEKGGEIYKYFGVHFYRKLLVWVGWEKINRQNNPINKDQRLLSRYERNTRISEFGHTIIALIVFLTILLVSRSLEQAKWLLITNLLLNIYPIMLQRFNRPRLRRIICIGSKAN